MATDPPCITSNEVEGLNRNLKKCSEIGSTVKLLGSSGGAVLPNVFTVIVEGFTDGSPTALKL